MCSNMCAFYYNRERVDFQWKYVAVLAEIFCCALTYL